MVRLKQGAVQHMHSIFSSLLLVLVYQGKYLKKDKDCTFRWINVGKEEA